MFLLFFVVDPADKLKRRTDSHAEWRHLSELLRYKNGEAKVKNFQRINSSHAHLQACIYVYVRARYLTIKLRHQMKRNCCVIFFCFLEFFLVFLCVNAEYSLSKMTSFSAKSKAREL